MSLLLVTLLLLSARTTEPERDGLVDQIQAHYDAVEDFEADFTQIYERRLLGKTLRETGTVAIQKPGRMRWEYEKPERKVFVTAGEKTYFYLPEENQVIVGESPEGTLGLTPGSPLSLLAGRIRLRESFEILPPASEAELGGAMLRLSPRTPQPEFDQIELEADPASGRVLRIVLIDIQGNRTEFRFDNVRENRGLPDSLFRFKIPPGVDILFAGESRGAVSR